MYWKRFLHDFGVANFAFVMPSVQKMKFSEAILKGEELGYKETFDSYRGCAIGTAYRAKTGELLSHRLRPGLRRAVSEEFGVPLEIVEQADWMHCGGTSRVKVAAWLASKGY